MYEELMGEPFSGKGKINSIIKKTDLFKPEDPDNEAIVIAF